MFLDNLYLKDFRNFDDVRFDFPEKRIFITGDNRSGKSNLLEAIHFLSLAKSGRGSRDKEVLRHSGDDFSISASFTKGGDKFELRIYYHPQIGKKAYLNSRPLPRLFDLIGVFNSVLFSPEDVDLVLRFPSQRRRILDILVSQSSVSYLSDLQTYRRALAQRNHLLRDSPKPGGLLESWDDQLVDLGTRIIKKRIEVIDQVKPDLIYFYNKLCPKAEDISLCYETTVGCCYLDRISESFLARLRQKRRKEFLLGHTLTGPHRDNLNVLIDNEDAQKYASQGQLKSVLLAWKLSEALFLENATGEKPILLLDDAFSELDSKRLYCLLETIQNFGQVFITSAQDPNLPTKEKGFINLRIEDGKGIYN